MPTTKSQQPKTLHATRQLQRAATLEEQLAALPPKGEIMESAHLTMQLCEVLSDVILSSPTVSLKKDVFGRLWRNCFYKRIGELRTRVAREARKKGPHLKTLQGNLQVFLKEAIDLYDYLIRSYESKLVPPSTQSQEEEESVPMDTDGVVAGLSRLLLHMGDLQRYSERYGVAEQIYSKAAKLAPGKGNPYNQLAVVAQLKDTTLSCVSLYYYARALLATHEPFDTAEGNLMRLFQTNHDWVVEYHKKNDGDREAGKAAASRAFLAHFVDLHFDLFLGVRKSSEDQMDDAVLENDLAVKIKDVTERLDGCLEESSFGDTLLCRMATINAFSIAWAAKTRKSAETVLLAQAFVLVFGASLAARLERGLEKYADKQVIPSVRVLLPLLLLCEYVDTLGTPEMGEGTDSSALFSDAKHLFWRRASRVATLMVPIREVLSQHDSPTDQGLKEYERLRGFGPFDPFLSSGNDEDVYLSAEEAVCALGLLSTTQDSTVSEKSNSGSHENHVKVERFFSVMDRIVAKGQLLAHDGAGQYRCTLAEQEDPIVDEDDEMEDDAIADFETDSPFMSPSPKDSMDIVQLQPVNGADSSDVLVYKQSETGPALLVPGALLLNKAEEAPVAPKEIVPTSHQVINAATESRSSGVLQTPLGQPGMPQNGEAMDMVAGPAFEALAPIAAQPAASLKPPPGIMPPPGFESAPPPPSQESSYPSGLANPAQSYPPPQVGFPVYGGPQPQPQLPPQPQTHSGTVLEMLGAMDASQIQTNNPFLGTSSFVSSSQDVEVAPPGLFGGHSNAPSNSHFLDRDDATPMDGSSLLDSSLLNSLMMDDSTNKPLSKNPFLT